MSPEISLIQNIISKALQSNRLAHAYLIVGQRTNTRRNLVKQIASLLLCKKPAENQEGSLEPCKTCTSCKKVALAIHPDLFEITPQGESIRIEQIRQLQKEVVFAPLEGKRRVIIVDRAETMGPSASNALLKILEEPPSHTVLLLSASSSSALLPTILSRCQILRQVYTQSKASVSAGETDDVSHRPNNLIRFLENELAIENQDEIHDALELRKRLLNFIVKQGPDKKLSLLDASSSLSLSKKTVRLTVAIINSVIRDIFLIRHLASRRQGKRKTRLSDHLINSDSQELLVRLAQGLNYDTLVAYKRKLALAQTMIERNVKTEMITDMLLIFWLKNRKQ